MSHEYKKIINKIDSFNQTLKAQSNLNCIISDLSKHAQDELDYFSSKLLHSLDSETQDIMHLMDKFIQKMDSIDNA